MNLREIFKDDFAKSAFQVVNGESRIIGRFGQISLIDDVFDIWFVGKELAPLSTVRINALPKKLPPEAGIRLLTGEAYFQTTDIELARKAIPLLGIRKKHKYSEEYKQMLRDRLAGMRK